MIFHPTHPFPPHPIPSHSTLSHQPNTTFSRIQKGLSPLLHIQYTHKVYKILKSTFDIPSDPIPSHPTPFHPPNITFSRFQKCLSPAGTVFKTTNTLSYTNKMERAFNLTPWNLLPQTPSVG